MNDRKILVIGSGGQLGTDMCREATKAGCNVVALDYPEIDIGNRESVQKHIIASNASAIVNCAAFTNVDVCESEQEKAFLLNADGPGFIAEAAERIGARMVHISTDYVFSGDKTEPYLETDEVGPRSVYGKSKLAGELRVAQCCADHQIVRIAWLYGLHGGNFVRTIRMVAAKKAAENGVLSVVNDQSGTPTSTVQVCRQILAAMNSDITGVLHATCEGYCTWFEFAQKIIAKADIPVTVVPCTTEEFPRPAPRPKNSRLENSRLKAAGLAVMDNWEEAFNEFLRDETVPQEQ
jgi:dTDP-4-dehydrorhamnose reductase